MDAYIEWYLALKMPWGYIVAIAMVSPIFAICWALGLAVQWKMSRSPRFTNILGTILCPITWPPIIACVAGKWIALAIPKIIIWIFRKCYPILYLFPSQREYYYELKSDLAASRCRSQR